MSVVEYKKKEIRTGSIALFASAGCIGGCIRRCQKEANPLGISHVGIVIVDSPSNVYEKIKYSIYLNDQQREFVKKQIQNRQSQKPEIFVLEATGSIQQVVETGYPFVMISQFSVLKDNYDGNIYIRPCKKEIQFDWEQYLGISYERQFKELIRSTKNTNFRNSRQTVFCSELVAWILNQEGYYKACPSDCTPAELCSCQPLENFEDYEIF